MLHCYLYNYINLESYVHLNVFLSVFKYIYKNINK